MVGHSDRFDGGIVVSVVVIGISGTGETASISGNLKLTVGHNTSTVDHRDCTESLKHASNIFGLGGFDGIISIMIRDADETRRRVAITRQTAHAGAGTKGLELGFIPSDGIWTSRRKIHVIAQVFVVPSIARLVCHNIDVVVEDFHTLISVFDHDATISITDDPVQERAREFFVDGLVDEVFEYEESLVVV